MFPAKQVIRFDGNDWIDMPLVELQEDGGAEDVEVAGRGGFSGGRRGGEGGRRDDGFERGDVGDEYSACVGIERRTKNGLIVKVGDVWRVGRRRCTLLGEGC